MSVIITDEEFIYYNAVLYYARVQYEYEITCFHIFFISKQYTASLCMHV